MFRSMILAVATLTGLAGCVAQTTEATVEDQAVLDVAFSCDNGEVLSVSFFPAQEMAILKRHGDSIELEQKPAASGFWYGNGPNSIRGKGDSLTVEIGRMVPIQCHAR